MITKVSEKKELILAAGVGTRLAPITDTIPKALVAVNGKPILLNQIENLISNGVFDITIVVGYKADVVEKTVHYYYPDIKIVESVNYSSTNNMYSAFLGMKSMFCHQTISPFYMMNADVFYDSSVITSLENDHRENLIVVDVGSYSEESMKVIENCGRIVSISKQINQLDALGCSIDVYKFGSDGGNAFFHHCKKYIEEKKEWNKWSELAINDALNDAVFRVSELNGKWMEIDTIEDLKRAELIFRAEKI